MQDVRVTTVRLGPLLLLLLNCWFLGSHKPRDMFVRVQLQKDRRKTYKTIRKSLGSAGYRPDLLEVGVSDRDLVFTGHFMLVVICC